MITVINTLFLCNLLWIHSDSHCGSGKKRLNCCRWRLLIAVLVCGRRPPDRDATWSVRGIPENTDQHRRQNWQRWTHSQGQSRHSQGRCGQSQGRCRQSQGRCRQHKVAVVSHKLAVVSHKVTVVCHKVDMVYGILVVSTEWFVVHARSLDKAIFELCVRFVCTRVCVYLYNASRLTLMLLHWL